MNTNKSKSKLQSAMSEAEPVLEEAVPFSVAVEVVKNHVIIKLPRKALKYLKINKGTKLSVIPINNVLHLTTGKALTLIPALDMSNLESQFVSQV